MNDAHKDVVTSKRQKLCEFLSLLPEPARQSGFPSTALSGHDPGDCTAVCSVQQAVGSAGSAALLGYFFAWVGHFFLEKTGQLPLPITLYSLMADFLMLFQAQESGRLDHRYFSAPDNE